MITRADILSRRDEILAVAARNGASHVRIFGSIARGDARGASDLDLLVRFEPGRSLMDHGMLVEELQQLLDVKVDVVSEGALREHDRFRDEGINEAIPL
jgi:predicted nucleotidyltransferase